MKFSTGKKCEVNIDDCVDNPCKNGATCIDGIESYTCQCENGFTGESCIYISKTQP